jgi:signal transduction histidine kinase
MENELKISLKEEVDKAYKIVDYIYYQNLDKPKSEVIKMIKNALRTIRFNENRGYIFIYTLEGKNILNSAFPAIEEKDFKIQIIYLY